RNGGVEHAVGEAPLVVVPRTHLDQVAGDLGQAFVHRAGGGRVIEVGRHQRLVGVGQNALEGAFGGGRLEDGVDFVHRGFAGGHERQVDQRDVDGGHADGVAVELA